MTTALVQDGTTINYSTTAAVTAGSLLIIGSLPVVALESKAATAGAAASVACAAEGVFTLSKKAQATALAQGGRAYYVATGGVNKICSTAAAAKMVGSMWAAATTTATTCTVKLLGNVMPLETQA